MIWILFSGIAFGTLGIFVKKIYEAGITPLTTLTLRFVLATLVLSVLLLIQKKRGKITATLKSEEIQKALLLGAFGYAGFAFIFMQALELLTASTSVILLYTYPVFVWLGERFLLHEKQPKYTGLMIPIALTGIILLSQSQTVSVDPIHSGTKLIGLFYGVLSAALYAGYILASRKSIEKTKSTFTFSFFIHLGAALALLTVSFFVNGIQENGNLLHKAMISAPFEIVGLAIIPTVIAISLFLKGLETTTGLRASIGSITEPFSGILFSVWFLHENFGPYQGTGTFLVLIALIFNFKRSVIFK